ncbi:hypothetical protein J5N97_010357 [Dioscorea zingiberensis]|uniref:Uncharacterized protein n=1 Tax=Dioscorea zingiberensis TaxID=325984 RepID=A0A9D5D004_9LILI|nr:hypothetical protein J5N97_010357 [Dioscorea zingiberensis]
MERSLKKCDKESMKMAMLKHEETFREQVHELHRLYGVQKVLMSDMKKQQKVEQIRPHWTTLDLEVPAMPESDDENDLELTLAIGRSRSKKEERSSCVSDSGMSFSSSSVESARVKLSVHDRGMFHSDRRVAFMLKGQ